MAGSRRILYATDFSPPSRAAFRKAMERARATGGELVVVHVLPPVVLSTLPDVYIPPETYDSLQASARAGAQRRLDRLVKRARRAGVRASSQVVDGLPVHERIVRTAAALRAGMIVMGTHGRSGVRQALLGSVAARVVARAGCPVMTVRGR